MRDSLAVSAAFLIIIIIVIIRKEARIPAASTAGGEGNLSTSGGMGKEADMLLRRMAERMSIKRGENYSSVVSFLRKRFRFDLLKICVITMRGYKKPPQRRYIPST